MYDNTPNKPIALEIETRNEGHPDSNINHNNNTNTKTTNTRIKTRTKTKNGVTKSNTKPSTTNKSGDDDKKTPRGDKTTIVYGRQQSQLEGQ